MSKYRSTFVVVLLVAGLAGVAWGVIGLQRIFTQEKNDTLSNIEARRSALSQYAHEAIKSELKSALESQESRIERALTDPLVSDENLFYQDRGKQLLPRLFAFNDTRSQEWIKLYQRLVGEKQYSDATEKDSPWVLLLELRERFIDAVVAQDQDDIEQSFRMILNHRARFKLDARKDIVFSLALLEFFSNKNRPAPGLVKSLIRDGITGTNGATIEGIQRKLLHGRGRFSREEFRFLANKVNSILRQSNIAVYKDFTKRIDDVSGATLALENDIQLPVLFDQNSWYIESRDQRELAGVRTNFTDVVKYVENDMRGRALIDTGDRVHVQFDSPTANSVDTLVTRIQSIRWEQEQENALNRFWLKTVLISFCAILILLVLLATWLSYRRKHAYLEMKSDLIAAVSHELKTPLTSIRLMGETLHKRLDGIPQAKDYPRRIVQDVDGLGFMVDNILSFNRLAKGRVELEREQINLGQIVETVRHDMSNYSNSVIEWRLDNLEKANLTADSVLLKLLLMNLARNACLHNKRSPVQIMIEWIEPKRIMIFRDNGVGITKEKWKSVFEEFVRLDRDRSRGSGLGLAICKQIMKLHKGTIRIQESSADGTAFALHFPA